MSRAAIPGVYVYALGQFRPKRELDPTPEPVVALEDCDEPEALDARSRGGRLGRLRDPRSGDHGPERHVGDAHARPGEPRRGRGPARLPLPGRRAVGRRAHPDRGRPGHHAGRSPDRGVLAPALRNGSRHRDG